MEKDKAADEYVIGRYCNHEPEYVFTNKSLTIVRRPQGETTILPYSEIIKANLAGSDAPDWKKTLAANPSLRQIGLTLSSDFVLTLPVMNETSYDHKENDVSVGWDLFEVHSLFWKIAFFNAKSNRPSP